MCRKIAVIAVTDNGLEFEGIYSNEKDAEQVGAQHLDKGNVILMSFEQTVTDEIPEERGVFNTNPMLRVLKEQIGQYLS